jgi:hypothetical protein
MPKKTKLLNRQRDGKIAGENLSGRPVPKRAGVRNETTGKAAGVGNVRRTGGRDTRKAS